MIGLCGVSCDDFGFLTPRETSIIFDAYIKRQDSQEQEKWNRARWQTTALINIQLKPVHRKSPIEMFKFPWDEKDETKIESTKERFEELKEKWKKLVPIKNK